VDDDVGWEYMGVSGGAADPAAMIGPSMEEVEAARIGISTALTMYGGASALARGGLAGLFKWAATQGADEAIYQATGIPMGATGGMAAWRVAHRINVLRGAAWDPKKGVDYSNSKHLYQKEWGGKNMVNIKYTGNRKGDFLAADKEAFGRAGRPPGYTWHHLDDYDPVSNTGTLQLVKTGAHEADLPHGGGVRQYNMYHHVPYPED
jgi:hypothetical protein